jgi:adenylate cyclase
MGNAISIIGNKAGVISFAVVIISTIVSYFLVGPQEMLPNDALYIWPAVLIGGGYACILASQSFAVSRGLSRRRKQLTALNKQIKEQVLVRYLPPDLINDIFDGKLEMDTKPHTQQITVLFSDLSGFTAMSEKHGAEVVADFLNDYLSIMNETIFANQGTIDKFIGDAIMVIFGAPVSMSEEDQAKNACQCAIAMQHGMVGVNEKWKPKGIDKVSMRIGIHQGKAVVGNFGSKQRVDYTAIGPSVNMASRIETACEPGSIYISQEIRKLLNNDPPTNLVGDFELKGITGKTSLYKLV